MQKVIEAVLFGFTQILNFEIIKFALFIGGLVSAFWIVVGFFLWDKLHIVSGFFIDLIPFSMLRADGAWLLSSFLWFGLVLITFSILMTFIGNIVVEKISKEKYGIFSLSLVLFSAFFWLFIWFLYDDIIYNQFLHLLNWLPFETVDASISYLLNLYFIYGAIIVSMLIVTSFFSEKIIEIVKNRNFPYDRLLDENQLEIDEHRIKDIVVYAIVSIMLFPLLFIPILNFIIQIVLWIWLIKDILVNDSASLFITKDKEKNLIKYKKGFLTISFITALFNFLPLFNIFGAFFGEIAMFYYMKEIKKELESL